VTAGSVYLNEHQEHKANLDFHQAADYTLAEVILATSLFLFGVAGISARWRIKIGALSFATLVFLIAVVVLATV
jgi:hypothetical protein